MGLENRKQNSALLCGIILAVIGLALHSAAYAQRAGFLAADLQQFVTVDAQVIAITNVRVVDGTGAPAREGLTILIREGRLAAIGDAVPVPPDSGYIDGTGLTAKPGLVMMHEHLFYGSRIDGSGVRPAQFAAPPLYLAHGVTTARTVGSYAPYTELQMKRYIGEGRLLGPDLDISIFIMGPEPARPSARALALAEADDAQREVRFWAGRGATSVKIYIDTPEEHIRAAVAEAHRLGLKVAAHLCVVSAADGARLGMDSLEHGLRAITDFVPDRTPGQCSYAG